MLPGTTFLLGSRPRPLRDLPDPIAPLPFPAYDVAMRRVLVPVAVAAGIAIAAGVARADVIPIQVAGASYAIAASAAGATLRGGGELTLDGKFEATVRGTARGGKRFVATITHWKLNHREPRTRLELRFRVTASSGAARCPIGTRGRAVLVDDPASAGDGSGDRVSISFAGRRCKALARSWVDAASGARARVGVELDVVPGIAATRARGSSGTVAAPYACP